MTSLFQWVARAFSSKCSSLNGGVVVGESSATKKRRIDGTVKTAEAAASTTTTTTPVQVIREGKAEILYTGGGASTDNPSAPPPSVFYNPIQEFNRDMSIAAITVWNEMQQDPSTAAVKGKSKSTAVKAKQQPHSQPPRPITILEALAASGLRSIRYALELPSPTLAIRSITTNDYSPLAVEAIRANAAHNNLSHIIQPSQGDAAQVMYTCSPRKFSVVDLDPYGSSSPFIDAAVQAVEDGGLLLVTCTDMAVLAGGQSDICFAKYGTCNLSNTPYCHEMGLRAVLHAVQTSASRYKKVIEPLASCSIDYYCRIFIRVTTSAPRTKQAASNTSLVFHCNGCKSFHCEPLGKYEEKGNSVKTGNMHLPSSAPMGPPGSKCAECGSRIAIAGPLWGKSLHNPHFLARMLAHITASPGKYGTETRMVGMLTVMQEELADCPFYYNVGVLSHRIHTAPVPSKQFASALLNMGCRYSYTHASPDCFKTDATPAQVWDIMRAYHCAEMARVNGGGAGSGGVLAGSKKRETDVLANTILAKMSEGSTTEMASMVDFTLHPDCELPSKKLKLRRFQHNPPNWGPMKKASANTDNNSNNGTSNASKEAEKKNQKMNKK